MYYFVAEKDKWAIGAMVTIPKIEEKEVELVMFKSYSQQPELED